ncbi:MAG TPA: caspase family protein [Chroococcidiopsis sp.]
MGKYWAIAIGINQYQDRRFQPLMYAQRDALAMHSFWVNEAGFSADCCTLLTDISPAVQPGVVYPSHNNIRNTINQVCQQLVPGDLLWCFFSGYGAQVDGQDYLMPIDADSAQIAFTGVALDTLMAALKTAQTDNIVLVLDMNRSSGALPNEHVGAQTLNLARQQDIATILSCKPDQSAHETIGLRQGLLTAALLEGLRYGGCVTLEHLSQYLGNRLPELSEHHWRPRQDPLVIIPAHQRYQLILPGKAIAPTLTDMGTDTATQTATDTAFNSAELLDANGREIFPPLAANATQTLPSSRSASGRGGNGATPATLANSVNSATPTSPTGKGTAPAQPPAQTSPPEPVDTQFWSRLIGWSSAIALLLSAGVIYNNWEAITGQNAAPETAPSPVSPNPSPTSSNPAPSPAGQLPDSTPSPSALLPADGTGSPSANSSGPDSSSPGANLAGGGSPDGSSPNGGLPGSGLPSSGLSAGGLPNGAGQNLIGSAPLGQVSPSGQSGQSGQSPSPVVNPPSPTNSAQPSATTDASSSLLEPVRATLRSRNYRAALQQLDRIPAAQRTGDYSALAQQAAQGILLEARATISRPRALTQTNQASDFNSAIQIARRLRPEHPYYSEAQRDIARWSEVILELARSRASQPNGGSSQLAVRNYGSAIAAARLVPGDQGALYAEAQRSINAWSQSILNAAQAQANSGQIAQAVEFAQLIPANTPAYATVQPAIAVWRSQLDTSDTIQ